MKDYMRMNCDNEEVWDVPLEVIAEHRADKIAKEESEGNPEIYYKVYDEEFDLTMEQSSTSIAWAKENMTWGMVKMYAIRMNKVDKSIVDYDNAWKEHLEVVYH